MFGRRFTKLLQSAERCVCRRYLNLQEYQSKALLQNHDIRVQNFIVAQSEEEAREKIKAFHADEYVVKAQILAGGRGKGHFLPNGLKGGIKITNSKEDAVKFAGQMIGNRLVTKQTPEEGVLVQRVMICESVHLTRETYLAFLLDRETNGIVLVASPHGGMDIEEVATTNPTEIFKIAIDVKEGISKNLAQELSKRLGFLPQNQEEAADILLKLYWMFTDVDATQIEINPFSETLCERVFCVDAKFNFDDNAKFRQEAIFALDDHAETDAAEVEANKHNLNFINMHGNIACLVNGAGLAMATMDMIHLHGGSPANFLDVGGGVKEEQVLKAFQIITSDKQIDAILVNIFGGIVNCETIAQGLIGACNKMQLKIPLVVRLEGTNVDSAKQMLKDSKLPIISATDLDDAAQKAVNCSLK